VANFDGEAFVRRFFAVWDEHDIDGIVEMFTDDIVFEPSFGTQPYGERAVGKAAARKLVEAVFERFPDLRYVELRHFVTPQFAAVESVATGTPAGGARYQTHLIDVLTIRDGKIAAKRSYRKVQV